MAAGALLFGQDARQDASWIESQIGVLRSLNVAAYVVKQLRLGDDPDFAGSPPGLLDKIRLYLGGRPAAPPRGALYFGQFRSH